MKTEIATTTSNRPSIVSAPASAVETWPATPNVVALERDRVGHHVGDGDALARMLAHQEARGASVAAAEVEHGRSRRAGAETQAEELAQQPVRAPAAAEVVEDRAARELVVQAIEKAQQRIGRRDAPIDAIVADREAQVVVE